MALGSTQPLPEMSTMNLPGGKKRPARRAENLTAICEPNVWKCGILNLSQPYGPLRAVRGIALPFKLLCLLSSSSSSSYFRIRPSSCFTSQLIWNHWTYIQTVGLLGRVISNVARPLPTQGNINTEEIQRDIHALSGIRTHDPSVWAGEDSLCHCDWPLAF
jgi:hypothetical protein